MLAVLLAYSSTFQTLVGASTPTEALARIAHGQAEEAGDEPLEYPRAYVEEIERSRTNKATRTFVGRGALLLNIEAQPPDDQLETVEAQRTWFKTLVDAIELDLRTTSSSRATPTGYSVSHFQLKDITWNVEPFLMPEAEREDQASDTTTLAKPLWCCQLRVEY